MNQAEPNDALKRLDAFIGEWGTELGPSSPSPIEGRVRSVFEWVLGGEFAYER